MSVAQEQPKPKKDTVNIDTDAKPTFYYAEEEAAKSKGGIPVVAIIAGVAVVSCCRSIFHPEEEESIGSSSGIFSGFLNPGQ